VGDSNAFLLLPTKNAQTYQLFKNIAEREFGFQTIYLTEKPTLKYDRVAKQEILRTSDQYFGNIMMKANLKFGGVNHSTKQVQGLLKNTLILGADVTHPGVGAIEDCPSIAAIVGSVDDKGMFRGSMRLQD
jgi:eukaryotic translation initiation factor 2C